MMSVSLRQAAEHWQVSPNSSSWNLDQIMFIKKTRGESKTSKLVEVKVDSKQACLTSALTDRHGVSCSRRISSFRALRDTAGNQLTLASTVVS